MTMPPDFGIEWLRCPQFYQHLRLLGRDNRIQSSLLFKVIPPILGAICEVGKAVRISAEVDLQLNMDVQAENLLRAAVKHCPFVKTACSEKDPVEKPVAHIAARLETPRPGLREEVNTVTFDALNCFSNNAPNWRVGTIVGIWDGSSALRQSPRDRQVAGVLGVYGPRTTAIVAIRTPENMSRPICFEVDLLETHRSGFTAVMLVRPELRFAEDITTVTKKYFAPANLRAAIEFPKYMLLVQEYIINNYNLRHSGLVPDVIHALVKGHGIYLLPVTAGSPVKPRRLYTLCPVALIIECAGGKAVDPATGRGILDKDVRGRDERSGLVCGTPEEVDMVLKKWLGNGGMN